MKSQDSTKPGQTSQTGKTSYGDNIRDKSKVPLDKTNQGTGKTADDAKKGTDKF